MAKIQTYALADTPLSFSDKLIGTEVNGPIPNATKNFSLGELYNLFATLPNVGDLQETLNAGNTATQNINLTGQITSTSIRPTDILDRFGSSGEVFQVISRAVTGFNWVNLPVSTLQSVLNSGNTATQNITLTGNITSTRVIPGNIQDVSGSIGSTGQVLFKSSTGPLWANSPFIVPNLQQVTDAGNTTTNDVNVNSLGVWDPVAEGYGNLSFADGIFSVKNNSNQFIFSVENAALYFYNGAHQVQITSGLLTATRNYELPNAGGRIPLSVNGNTADTSGAITIPVGSTQDLQQVTDEGSSTTNPITINTRNVTSLVVNSNSDEDDSQGISVYGGYLAIGATGISNGIFSIAESIGIKTEATNGTSLLTKLSNATLEGVRIESSYLSTGTPLRITKADSVGTLVDKLTVNQAGELTATKLIKEGGTNLQFLMADGSTTTGGSGGITSINTLTGAAQTLVTGTTGTDFAIVSSGTSHLFNLPTASASNRGALSSADWTTFNSKGSGTVTSVAALTLGTIGTDLSSTVANGTTTPVITLNVPDASTAARGVITTAAQTMAGGKTFTLGNQVVGWGAIGISDNNDTENNYAGVKGQGLQDSKGVWGTATNGIGIYGSSQNGTGIVAQSTSGNHAVLGDFSSNSTYVTNSGRVLIKTNVDNTVDALQVNGNIKADNTRYIIKSTGATNSTTTLATCGLNTPTLTAGTYRFSILVAYNAVTTTTGARFVIDGTGTAPTNLNFSMIRTLTATTQQPNFGSAYLVPSTATPTSLTTGNICKIDGIITLPSTSVLSVKFASSSTLAITVLAGSYFEYF